MRINELKLQNESVEPTGFAKKEIDEFVEFLSTCNSDPQQRPLDQRAYISDKLSHYVAYRRYMDDKLEQLDVDIDDYKKGHSSVSDH